MIKQLSLLTLLLFVLASALSAQHSQTKEELTQLLNRFLRGASENSIEMHDRFWAEDLIYTSSSGQRYGKEHIMDGLQNSGGNENEPATEWSAENIQIRIYGNVATLAFKLVGETNSAGGIERSEYLNSGTFVKRDGQWKAVNWQATKVPG